MFLQGINAHISDASDAMQGQQLQIWAALCQRHHRHVCELDTPRQIDVLQRALLRDCCNGLICTRMQADQCSSASTQSTPLPLQTKVLDLIIPGLG